MSVTHTTMFGVIVAVNETPDSLTYATSILVETQKYTVWSARLTQTQPIDTGYSTSLNMHNRKVMKCECNNIRALTSWYSDGVLDKV